MNSPFGHSERTFEHASPLSTEENVTPCVHGAHTRSVVSDPSLDLPLPAVHVRHGAHD
jgi:hypothetical protein